jgi:hypothetical protein
VFRFLAPTGEIVDGDGGLKKRKKNFRAEIFFRSSIPGNGGSTQARRLDAKSLTAAAILKRTKSVGVTDF